MANANLKKNYSKNNSIQLEKQLDIMKTTIKNSDILNAEFHSIIHDLTVLKQNMEVTRNALKKTRAEVKKGNLNPIKHVYNMYLLMNMAHKVRYYNALLDDVLEEAIQIQQIAHLSEWLAKREVQILASLKRK